LCRHPTCRRPAPPVWLRPARRHPRPVSEVARFGRRSQRGSVADRSAAGVFGAVGPQPSRDAPRAPRLARGGTGARSACRLGAPAPPEKNRNGSRDSGRRARSGHSRGGSSRVPLRAEGLGCVVLWRHNPFWGYGVPTCFGLVVWHPVCTRLFNTPSREGVLISRGRHTAGGWLPYGRGAEGSDGGGGGSPGRARPPSAARCLSSSRGS
jgi:hypothetical protein